MKMTKNKQYEILRNEILKLKIDNPNNFKKIRELQLKLDILEKILKNYFKYHYSIFKEIIFRYIFSKNLCFIEHIFIIIFI